MYPERKQTINGRLVEEYYWGNRYPCYVDNRLSADSYEVTLARIASGLEPNWKH